MSTDNSGFSHLDDQGKARMVDVGQKSVTRRMATASAVVEMSSATLQTLRNSELAKGDALQVARIAGIQAAKQTSNLIPLCHPLPVSSVEIEFQLDDAAVRIEATVQVEGKTGVEMEALTAVSVSALAIYDMCKSMERGIRIARIQLEKKSGGKSGDFVRETDT